MPVTLRITGRTRQPHLPDVAALRALPELEDALWVATAAPVNTLRADEVFLSTLDSDGDGRIRSDEVRAAIRWTFEVLADPSGIREGNTTLQLGQLATEGDGAVVRAAAERVLTSAGTDGAAEVSLAQVRAVRAEEEARGLSAAGRLLPVAAGDDEGLKGLIARAIEVTGGVPHPSGDLALDEASFDAFLEQGRSWLDWSDQGAVPVAGGSEVQPFGEGTASASAALEAVRAKLSQYFLLCDAIRLDADLAARAKVDASETDLLDVDAATRLLERAPLAPPRADGVLDLDGAINPAWTGAVRALREAALRPAPGERATLDRAGFEALDAKLAPHRAWVAAQPATTAGSGGAEALRAQLADSAGQDRVRALIAESTVAAVVLDGVKLLERAILMQAWLLPFVNSFAAMPDLYDADREALFEQGVLVIDGRRFEFCVRVPEPARAEKFAAASPMFTMFVTVGRRGSEWEYEVAVPVTAGEREHLVEGMWGVFHDRDGRELHAQIRKLAVSPISIKEALLTPFRRMGEAVQGAFDKAAASQTEAVGAKVSSTAEGAVDKATSAPTALAASGAPPAADAAAAAPAAAAPAAGGIGGQLPMLLAGAGVAVAALSSAAAYILDVFWSGAGSLAAAVIALPMLKGAGPTVTSAVQVLALPVAVLVLLLGIITIPALLYAIPVVISTWLRLRQRDVATLLEGAGWAINTRLYLDRKLAVQLTQRPNAPKK